MASYLFPTLLIIIVCLLQSAEGGCGLEYGGRCYSFIAQPKTFLDAMMLCHSRGSHFLELKDYNQEVWLDLILRLLGMKRVWIGFTDIQKEGHWVAFSNRKKITYSNWRNGEPNNAGGNEHCAAYATNGRSPSWTDNKCTEKLRFVCRY